MKSIKCSEIAETVKGEIVGDEKCAKTLSISSIMTKS